MADDLNLCSDNNGDGCGKVFVNKSAPGLCAKCRKLSSLKEGTPEYNAWKVSYALMCDMLDTYLLHAIQLFKQCSSCGAAWKNFEGGICGSCSVRNAKDAIAGGEPAHTTVSGGSNDNMGKLSFLLSVTSCPKIGFFRAHS